MGDEEEEEEEEGRDLVEKSVGGNYCLSRELERIGAPDP